MPFVNGTWVPPTSMINNNNPQSVQNYLTMANQNAGMGNQNRQMTALGQTTLMAPQPIQAIQNTGAMGPTMPQQTGPMSFGQQAAQMGIYTNPNPSYTQYNQPQTIGGSAGVLGKNYVEGYQQVRPGMNVAITPNGLPVGASQLPGQPQNQVLQTYNGPASGYNSVLGGFYFTDKNAPGQQLNIGNGGDGSNSNYYGNLQSARSYGGPENWTSSDEDKKKNIHSADSKLEEFLNHLQAYSYEYKDPKYGEGKQISPMAQDIEKSDLGKPAIVNTEEGKMVNYGKLAGIQLAALALLNDKYNKLEAQLKEVLGQKLMEKNNG